MKKLLLTAFALYATAAFPRPVLMGDTNHSRESVYFPGEPVELTFRISGLEPKKPGPDLRVRIVDELDRELAKYERKLLADWHGCEEIVIKNAPNGRLGFYRVYAALADGTKLVTPWASRRDCEMSYAVVRDPKTREKVDEDILMIYGNFDPRVGGYLKDVPEPKLDLLNNIPLEGQWRNIERNGPGSYVNNPDRDRLRLGRHVMLMSGACRWPKAEMERCFRMKNHRDSGRPAALTPEGEVAFTNMFTHYVRNYRRQYLHRTPRVYEISSEWEAAENGSRSYADIVRVYELAYAIVRAEDPEGIVCGPGYGVESRYTIAFLKAGLGRYIDALTVHPYFNPYPIEPAGIVQQVRAGREMVKKLAGRDLPVIDTECGRDTGDMKAREDEQMRHQVRLQTIYVGEGYRSLSLFCRIDYRLQPGFGYIYNLSYGRSHTDYGGDYPGPKTSPKPIYPAMSALCWFLTNSKPLADIPFVGKTVVGYVFKHVPDGRINLTLWDWKRGIADPNKVNLKVLKGAGEIEVADHMGNVRRVKANAKGEIPLELFDMPVYVLGVDPAIWEREDGERAQLAKEFAAAEEAARRAKGVEIVSVKPGIVGAASALEVELQDVSGRENLGTVSFTMKSTGGRVYSAPFRIAADEKASVLVPIGAVEVDPFTMQDLTVTATMADGRKDIREDRANFFVCPYFAAAKIDGDFSEWERLPAIPLRNCVEKPQFYQGPEDQTGTARIGWNEKGLVFCFDVDDDKYYMREGRSQYCWGADAVQIALANEYRYEKTGNTLLDLITEGKALYSFALVPEPYAHRHSSWDREESIVNHPIAPVDLNDGRSGYEMQAKVTKLPNGRFREQWEIQIPWHAINARDPAPGKRVAFGFILNDHDENDFGRYTGLGAFHLHFSERFGAMILGDRRRVD